MKWQPSHFSLDMDKEHEDEKENEKSGENVTYKKSTSKSEETDSKV